MVMSKVSDAIKRCSEFVNDVKAEMQKSVWPTKPELAESTMVVVITLMLLGSYVGLSDLVLLKVITFLAGLRG